MGKNNNLPPKLQNLKGSQSLHSLNNKTQSNKMIQSHKNLLKQKDTEILKNKVKAKVAYTRQTSKIMFTFGGS